MVLGHRPSVSQPPVHWGVAYRQSAFLSLHFVFKALHRRVNPCMQRVGAEHAVLEGKRQGGGNSWEGSFRVGIRAEGGMWVPVPGVFPHLE